MRQDLSAISDTVSRIATGKFSDRINIDDISDDMIRITAKETMQH